MKRLIPLLILAAASSVWAVSASHWLFTNDSDWKPGTFHNVVSTNLGDLKLSRAVKTLLGQDPRISAVYSLVQAKDGTIYAGTSPQGVLLQIKGDKVSDAAVLDDATSIFSLLIDQDGKLLLGTGGEKGRIYRIEKPGAKPHPIFEAEGVQYIWAMQQTADGNIYAATGPNGQLFEITPDGKSNVLLASEQNNLLCLLSDGKDTLYCGSDPDGLVYRVDRKTKKSFVLFNAPESEISALAMDAAGNLYAGTAEVSDEAGNEQGGAHDRVGRPESEQSGVPIAAQPPAVPQPPAMPQPNPGQPQPIPKGSNPAKDLKAAPPQVEQPKHMMIGAAKADPADGDDPGDGPEPAPDKPAPPGAGNPNNPGAGAQPGGKNNIPPQAGPNAQPRAEGNAIYRIEPSGLVTEIFREPALVMSILEKDGLLIAATGSDGLVYQINPAAEETVVIAKVDPKQVLCLLPSADGRIMMGTANVGGIAAMSSGFATKGTYVSPVLDAKQISRFGKIHLHGLLPPNTGITVATRSGNVKDPSEKDWSAWSADVSATEFIAVPTPAARFFQYRLTFGSGNDQNSPVIQDIDVSYQMPNLAPVVRAIKILPKGAGPAADAGGDAGPPSPAGPQATNYRYLTIAWDASDPNNDALVYSLYFRTGSSGPWILLKDKLKDPMYDWDTRSVADGRYQIKVEASDAQANPIGQGKTASRVSDPVLVDNTPPIIGDIQTHVAGNDVRIELKAADQVGIVAGIDYAVDSSTDWQATEASDSIYDGPEEGTSFTVAALSPGAHVITVRATDEHGNQAYESIHVNIEAPATAK